MVRAVLVVASWSPGRIRYRTSTNTPGCETDGGWQMAERAEKSRCRRPATGRLSRGVCRRRRWPWRTPAASLTILARHRLGAKPMSVYYHVASKADPRRPRTTPSSADRAPEPRRWLAPEMERRAHSTREVLAGTGGRSNCWSRGHPRPGQPPSSRHGDRHPPPSGFSPELTARLPLWTATSTASPCRGRSPVRRTEAPAMSRNRSWS